MSFNPIPSLGGASWSGNPPVATTRQLLSTSAGIIEIIDNLPVNPPGPAIAISTFSTLVASTFYTPIVFADGISSLRISTGSLTTGSLGLTGSLDMNNNNITNVNTIGATTGNFTNITGSINGDGTFANLTVNNSATFNNTITNFTYKTLSNVQNINSGTGALIGCNLNLTATNALNGTAPLVNLEANQGANVATNSEVTLLAQNGNRGKIMLDARPGYGAAIQGEIELKATGGSPPLGAPTLGGRILLNATNPTPLTSISPSYVLTTADSILSYAGGLTPLSGNYGYNYQQGLNGVNIVAGTVATIPNVPGTIYMYGTNLAGTGNSGGVRVQNGISVDTIYPYPTGFTTPAYDLILRGNAAGNKVTLSNVRTIQSDGGDLTGFNTAYSSNIDSQVIRTNNFTASNTAYISSLTVDDIIFSRQIEDFSILNVSSLFASTATIRKIILPNTPTYSIEQQFFSTSLGNFNTISSATNNVLSTSIQLTTASLPEISLINNQIFNNANINYWASTIVVAGATDQPILSNTLGGISPNTGRLVYRNLSGVPLVIYAPYNGGTTGLVIPQNSNWGFTYNGSYWDVNQNPTDIGGTYGTSFSLFQNYNNTIFKTPDIITLDSAVVNITGTLGDTDITTATIGTATINQLNSSNITLQNTPNYSIEQSFISTTGTPFVNISNATNYILSTSILLTATTLATNPIIPNLNIGNSNVDYWASTIQVATDFGAAPSIFNSLLPLTGGLTGQITYSNASITKTITINQFPNLIDIPPGSNYQFTWTGSTWSLNTNPTNTSGTSGTSFSLFQNYNNTTLKTPDLLTLDCAALNITGTLNGINIGTATIQEATATQIFTSNITMSNTPTFSIEQSFFSTTSEAFGKISTVRNLIISTSTGFTTGSQEQQPFIDNFRADATNIGTWASTVFIGPTTVDTYLNSLTDLRLGSITGGQIDYSARASPILIGASGAGGSTQYTVPANATYRYTWDGNNWNQNTNPPSRSATFGTSFALFQDYYNTTLKSPDTITIDSASLNITGVAKINQLNLNNIDLSTINTSNLTAVNGTITNLTTTNFGTTNFGARGVTYSTITGNPSQSQVGISQNTNYTTTGTRLNFRDSNLNFAAFPNISSLTSQNVFSNSINYNTYPGGVFTLISTHTGSIAATTLNGNGSITAAVGSNPNPWCSSMMNVYGGAAGSAVYDVIVLPVGVPGEFFFYGTQSPYGQYQVNIGGTGYQFGLTFNEYHRWTNLTGAGWSSNLNAPPYGVSTNIDRASLLMQPGGLLNLNSQYIGFGSNGLRVVSYNERRNTDLALVSGYGKAQLDNIPVYFQGQYFNSNDYNCTISFTDYGCEAPSLAVNQVAVNTYTINGLWYFQLRLTTATIPGLVRDAHWNYQVLLTPRILGTGTNSAAIFTDGEYEPINAPQMILSSITASTLSLAVTENLILAAGLGVPTVLGNEGINLAANSNINLVANNDVSMTAYHSMYLTATSSIIMSNAAGNAALGFDENATIGVIGSNVYLIASSNAVLSSSNIITIECPSTISVTSYDYYQAASNTTELHNENYSNTSRTSAHHITPNFVVSTCLNSYYIKNVRQPFIQYGDTTGSNNTGNTQVVLPVPYSTINSYKAFVTMEDSEPAEMSCVRNSSSTFTIYWQQAASGTHTIAWNTMGDVECGGGGEPPPPSEPAAYDLVNNIYGNTGYFTWSQDGAPDYETVYVLQSADDTDYATYTTGDFYTPEATFYSLPENYYYKFYVSSHYGGTRVDSSNSSSQYVFPM